MGLYCDGREVDLEQYAGDGWGCILVGERWIQSRMRGTGRAVLC